MDFMILSKQITRWVSRTLIVADKTCDAVVCFELKKGLYAPLRAIHVWKNGLTEEILINELFTVLNISFTGTFSAQVLQSFT